MKNKQMQIEFVDTERGNKILKALRSEGWRIADEYPMVFDKGIDYDFYFLTKNNEELKFEWTNWFEWKISGSKIIIAALTYQFKLVING
jgi:hypothetical protein